MRWFALVLFACGSNSPPPAPVQPAGEPADKCAHVADHLLSLLTDTAKEAPIEQLDAMRAKFNTHCVDDGWSPKAQSCFLGLRVKEEVDVCATLLTPAQRARLEQPSQTK